MSSVSSQPELKHPPRPPALECESICELYTKFREIFLDGNKPLIVTPCGHQIHLFEHHFFHMTGILVEGIEELSIQKERETILATTNGFAYYELREGGSRARHLLSARETMDHPDEVWQDNPKATSAKWVYIKEFDSKPYPFSVALIGVWVPREGSSEIHVPLSSFQVDRKGVRKWRQSTKIFP